ncbi:hypothetical protein OXPF_13570 [Oxobacter pfennigii]|uniref:Uncharacterized protein n=1 Tax=Oxobacter pfennigii TaxID=36849 RepID=A0A0P8YCJ1_9CLOT|nr:hypothetical protein [Oxobacter pfennigii]KPU44879.1 hypothetical protein OXPF_13570 [Oxobacter pfennigii]
MLIIKDNNCLYYRGTVKEFAAFLRNTMWPDMTLKEFLKIKNRIILSNENRNKRQLLGRS